MFVSPYVSIRLNYRLLITSNRARGGRGIRWSPRESRTQESLLGRLASRRRKASIIALRLLSLCRLTIVFFPFGIAPLVRGRELSASGYTLIRRGTRFYEDTQWRIRVYVIFTWIIISDDLSSKTFVRNFNDKLSH